VVRAPLRAAVEKYKGLNRFFLSPHLVSELQVRFSRAVIEQVGKRNHATSMQLVDSKRARAHEGASFRVLVVGV